MTKYGLRRNESALSKLFDQKNLLFFKCLNLTAVITYVRLFACMYRISKKKTKSDFFLGRGVRGMGWDGLMMGLYISWTYTSPFACILEYAVCLFTCYLGQHGWLGREQVSKYRYQNRKFTML